MKKFNIQLSMTTQRLEDLVSALKKVNANYHFFSLYSDTRKFNHFPEDFAENSYITFSGIKALRLSTDLKPEYFEHSSDYEMFHTPFKHSFFYHDEKKFDQQYYKQLSLPMLNKAFEIIDLNTALYQSFDEDVFIKPTSDLKAFTGGVLKKGQSIHDFIQNSARLANFMNEPALIAPVKHIHSEYRFFVINNAVITGSRYMLDSKVSPHIHIPESVLEKAHILATQYSPDTVFTMDLALLHNENIEIVEYNCFNTSGNYLCDLPLVLTLLQEM